MNIGTAPSNSATVDDYIQAADHQRWVQTVFGNMNERYQASSLEFRQVRERARQPQQSTAARALRHTGNLAAYQDH